MNTAEVKALTDEQIVQTLAVRERDLVTARFAKSANQLENTSSLALIRKDIARLNGEARAREIAGKQAKGSILGKQAKATAPSAAPAPANAEKGGFLKGIVDRLTTKE